MRFVGCRTATRRTLSVWPREITARAPRCIATRAVGAMLHWGFEQLGLNRIEATINPDNARSIRVAEKLGFVHVGPLDWKPEGGNGTFDAESYELNLV